MINEKVDIEEKQQLRIKRGEIYNKLGISRQAYSKWRAEERQAAYRKQIVLELLEERAKEFPKEGIKKRYIMIKEELRKLGINYGRDKVYSIAKAHGILQRRKRKGKRTTNSAHDFGYSPNLVKELEVNRINQVWYGDITYLRVRDDFMYLSVIIDSYSRKILGYSLREDLSEALSIEALERAIKTSKLGKDSGLIFHSDRGVQYASHRFKRLLGRYGILSSMAGKGMSYENAYVERVHRTLKEEFDLGMIYPDEKELKRAVSRAIKLYNSGRPHMSLGYKTPDEVYAQVRAA